MLFPFRLLALHFASVKDIKDILPHSYTVLPRVLVAQISHDCERPTEMKPSLYELIYDLPIHDFFGQLFLVRRLCVYKYLLVLLTALVTRICSQSVCASYYILGLSWALKIITLLSPSIMPRTALNKILL